MAYHTTGLTHHKFTDSLAHALIYEGARILDVISLPSPYVVEARNTLVAQFLKAYPCLYLLMVDADMEFPEDAISRSIVAAAQNNLPILCGDYALGNTKHSLFVKHEATSMFANVVDAKPNALYRNIFGGGTGWMLLRRDVLESMQNAFPAYHWFDRDLVEYDPDHPACADLVKDLTNPRGVTKLGEDVSFCRRADALGYEVAGHTGLELIHHKSKGTVHLDLAPVFADRPDVVFVGGKLEEETEEHRPADRSGDDVVVLRRGQGDSADIPVAPGEWGESDSEQPGPGTDADSTGHP